MNFILLIVFMLIALFVLKRRKMYGNNSNNTVPIDMRYELRYSLFTKTEYIFFNELRKQLPEKYYIFSKVRIIDFVKPKTRKRALLNRVIKKHVDFLICDSHFSPVLVIELDGSSHRNNKQQEKSDMFKNNLFDMLPIAFKRVQVGDDFKSSIHDIFIILK